MAEDIPTGEESPEDRAAIERPPRNFVVRWALKTGGEPIGYAVVELVAYFPTAIVGGEAMVGGENVASPAFEELFSDGLMGHDPVILQAVELLTPVVEGNGFRLEIMGRSGRGGRRRP